MATIRLGIVVQMGMGSCGAAAGMEYQDYPFALLVGMGISSGGGKRACQMRSKPTKIASRKMRYGADMADDHGPSVERTSNILDPYPVDPG